MKGDIPMQNLFLTSSGLNENTSKIFWRSIGKKPTDTKMIFVPSAAIQNDSAREGIAVCVERLLNMGISLKNILLYDLALLLTDGYQRTYSGYIEKIPSQFRLMTAQELNQYDGIVFCGGNARVLLDEINRTGLGKPLKQAVENGLVYLGISAGSMIAAGNFGDGLGFLTNPLLPHAENFFSCEKLTDERTIELADGQVLWIHGNTKEIIY